MKRPCRVLLFACWFSFLPWLRAAAPAAYVDDPGQFLPLDPPAAKTFEAKLTGFERATGVRILVRFQAKAPSAEDDKVPGAYMRSLAARLGTASRGALAVYFADEDEWRVWIGDESTPAFVGAAGTAKEFTDSGAMHRAKEALLEQAKAAADAALAARKQAAPPGRQLTPAERLNLRAGVLLDALIDRLGAKRSRGR